MKWADRQYAIGRGLAAIRHKNSEEEQHFIKGILDYYLPVILGGATGSTFPNVSGEELRRLKITAPDLVEQKAVARIFASLDNKIDLLHRQNKTLEELAETLFRQRFVEEAEDSWEPRSLFDSIELVGGGTPKTTILEYWNGQIKWLSAGDITNAHKGFIFGSDKTISDLGLNNSSANVLPKFSTIITARGTVGKYCMLSSEMAFSQSNYGILPKYENCYFFTYLLVAHSVESLLAAAYGTVFDTITTNTFKEQMMALPKPDQIVKFELEVSPFFKKMFTNTQQIQTLIQLRDELLPKLMSGEINLTNHG